MPDSTIALTDTIVSGASIGISATLGSTATLEATLWHDLGTDTGGAGRVFSGTSNYWGDPAFVNAGSGDYHIGSASAALDRGIDAGVDIDIDGDRRPSGAGFDLGADERVSPRHYALLPLARK